ncbi:hypothetical protein E2542_SST14497 [Spatholobus suberectus]|nr:hypothetical protein E2542_SST14497 [Spatholobus suberectus]
MRTGGEVKIFSAAICCTDVMTLGEKHEKNGASSIKQMDQRSRIYHYISARGIVARFGIGLVVLVHEWAFFGVVCIRFVEAFGYLLN